MWDKAFAACGQIGQMLTRSHHMIASCTNSWLASVMHCVSNVALQKACWRHVNQGGLTYMRALNFAHFFSLKDRSTCMWITIYVAVYVNYLLASSRCLDDFILTTTPPPPSMTRWCSSVHPCRWFTYWHKSHDLPIYVACLRHMATLIIPVVTGGHVHYNMPCNVLN